MAFCFPSVSVGSKCLQRPFNKHHRTTPLRGEVKKCAVRKGVGELVERWLELDANPASRKEIDRLVKAGRDDELLERLGSRLAFGTAGLRGLDGAGFNRMNTVTVQQTTQGLCKYLESCFGRDAFRRKGVVVGFDGRENSKQYADVVSKVLLSQGVRVVWFSRVVPTPFVAFAVTQQACLAGVMITASHNPKDYNGYKVYWANGCQIVSPDDSGIASAIDDHLNLWDIENTNTELREEALGAVSEAYYTALVQNLSFLDALESPSFLPIVYTPLHGVGWDYVRQAFDNLGLPVPAVVPQQAHPDAEFPTVGFPNPEEGAGVLELAFETAENNGASIVLANDPDADRLSVAEHQPTGEWKIFSGNDIGLMMGAWMWENFRVGNPGVHPNDCAMITTVVSSQMLSKLAAREGFGFHRTLTGFKWLGNKSLELQEKGVTVLFAFEEAIGFMPKGPVNDKDGISAAVVFAQLANYIYAKGMTIQEHLDAILSSLGQSDYLSGYVVKQPNESMSVFEGLRRNGYPKTVGGVAVDWVRDLGTGLDTSAENGQASLPWKPGDMMVTFGFTEGWLTLRASGTEPKLKYYLEVSNDTVPGLTALETARKVEMGLIHEILDLHNA